MIKNLTFRPKPKALSWSKCAGGKAGGAQQRLARGGEQPQELAVAASVIGQHVIAPGEVELQRGLVDIQARRQNSF